ncbi:MAG: MXAN_6640 family putative metalloprotease, partial [Actinomycetota bacterium]
VQFGYDIFEDLWILENTAVWMEDQVYGGINDNLQYLPTSSMRRPQVPLDFGAGFFEYGNFIFWKYATERFGTRLVKQVWGKADGGRGGPDLYSLSALRAVVQRRSGFGKTFANFAVANFTPEHHYRKGALYEDRIGGAPINKRFTLGRAKRRTALRKPRLDHLSSSYFSFAARKGVRPGARLKVNVDGPGRKSKPKATLVAYNGTRIVAGKCVSLNRRGEGSAGIRFGSRVTRVLLVLTNASTRFRNCFAIPTSPYSCAGRPLDQNRVFRFRARLLQ